MKYIIFIISILLFVPEITSAQSKPKRDISKDKSVIVARRKAAQTKPAAQKKKRNKQRRTYRKRTVEVEPEATYLSVSQLSPQSKILHAFGGSVVFDVKTDGKEWTITSLPSWCHIVKYPSWFKITYDRNPTHNDRQSWLEVKCDNQRSRIEVSQQGTPLNIKANFNYAYLLHNQYVTPVGQCLKITSEVTISGAAGQSCWVEAFIVDEDGNNIKAKSGYSNYALPYSNNLYAAREIIPSTDNRETFNVTLYIPNNAMQLLKKKKKLQCKLVVFCAKNREYISGATYTMKLKAKSKNGVVTTKYSK